MAVERDLAFAPAAGHRNLRAISTARILYGQSESAGLAALRRGSKFRAVVA